MNTFDIVYNLHDLDLSLDELVARYTEFLTDLVDPELMNEAWIHAKEDGRIVFGCEPYSLAEFLSIIIGHARVIIGGNIVWLNMLESSLTFRAVENDLEISYWRGISSQQIRSHLGKELVSCLCYELNCSFAELIAHQRPPITVRLPQQAWLTTSLHWARVFARLVYKVQTWEDGKLLNSTEESNASACNELKDFLSVFSQHDGEISQMVETSPGASTSL